MTTNAVETAATFQQRMDAVEAFIMHHVTDSHVLALPFVSVPLPKFLTAHGVMVALAALFLILLFRVFYRHEAAVPRGITNLLEVFVLFIRDQIVVPYLGREDGRRMTPLFCSFFFFILMMNLVGLVPCFQSATANLSVTAALGFVSLGFMIFGAMYRTGPVAFLKGFVPHGVPWPILIMLVPIEFISVFVRAFALMIRLFANELAGHMVIFFMLGLVIIFGWVALPFFALAVLIYIMEIGIAFLQAYIFTLLSAVFIGERYHPEH